MGGGEVGVPDVPEAEMEEFRERLAGVNLADLRLGPRLDLILRYAVLGDAEVELDESVRELVHKDGGPRVTIRAVPEQEGDDMSEVILIELHGGKRDGQEAYITAPPYAHIVQGPEGDARVYPAAVKRGVYRRTPDRDVPDGPLMYEWVPRKS